MESYYKNPYKPLSTEDENTSPDALPTHAQRNPVYTNKGILALTTSLVLLCAGLGAALYSQVNSACGTSYVPESSHIKVPHRVVTFLPHNEYTEQLPDEPGSVWDTLIPPGRGFVTAKRTNSGSLAFEEHSSVSNEDQSKEYYCISAFHQMHCLAIIFNALYSKNHSDHNHRDDHSDHTKHCIDYLRQSIMCASDATLEGSGVLGGDGNRAVDGWKNTHQCRDWDSLYNFASRHRMLDSDGIVVETSKYQTTLQWVDNLFTNSWPGAQSLSRGVVFWAITSIWGRRGSLDYINMNDALPDLVSELRPHGPDKLAI